ncbi:MAG: 6-hydroxymethylpterin diphosphokinase MptE-like protein [bacterium]
MISDCLAKNLSALSTHNSDVAEAIRCLAPDTRFRIHRSTSGWPVLVDEARGGAPLALLEDPLDEYRKQVLQLAPSGVCMPILFGFGSGYAFLAACLELGDRISSILVIEPEASLFRAVLSVLDLAMVLKNPGLRVVLGRDVEKIESSALDLLPNLVGTDWFVWKEPISWEKDGSYLGFAEQALDRLVERGKAEARLCSEWGAQIQENIWRNAHFALTCPPLSDFAGALANSPAILVSGGPSLEKDLPELAALESLPLVVAVDTCYPVLQRAGIEPHIVATCDPTPLNQRHFDATNPRDETILVFDPEVYLSVPERWPGPRLVLNAGESPTCAWFREMTGESVLIRKPISVAHAALETVLLLGCNPIVLLGCDFAYRSEGGESHVAGTVLGREHSPVEESQQALDLCSRGGTEAIIREPLVWLPGKRGGEVPASRTLAMFVSEFERRLAGSGVAVIDAGSDGTRLDGTERQTFDQVRSLLASSPLDRKSLRQILGTPKHGRSVNIAAVREDAICILDRAVLDADEGLRLCRMQEGACDSVSLAEIERLFWKIHRDPSIRKVYGLALYAPTFALVQRHGLDSPDDRRRKLKSYFETVVTARYRLYRAINASLTSS